jgi:succinate dehydrogenase / fumarate reductase membrane anchor subunit
MSLRTPLGRVRGLGTSPDTTNHWWAERLTAVALVPLTFMFVVIVMMLQGAERAEVVALMGNPLVAVTMLLVIITVFYHMKLAVQVVAEDYIHHEKVKTVVLILLPLVSVVLGTTCVFAVLKLAFEG